MPKCSCSGNKVQSNGAAAAKENLNCSAWCRSGDFSVQAREFDVGSPQNQKGRICPGRPGLNQTSCAQGKSRIAKYVVRLTFSYVMQHGLARYSSMFVPKFWPEPLQFSSGLSEGMQPRHRSSSSYVLQFPPAKEAAESFPHRGSIPSRPNHRERRDRRVVLGYGFRSVWGL